MPRGDKFIELTRYLETSGNKQIKLSFREIEIILGFKLCKSAYSYEEYWSNTKSHSISFAWMNAGCVSEQVNIDSQSIVFRKL